MYWQLSENFRSLRHVLNYGDTEGASLFAASAADAVLPAVGQTGIMGADRSGYMGEIEAGDIQILVDCRDVNPGRTRLAVAAVDTISLEIIP